MTPSLAAFTNRRREPAPELSAFELPPWPDGAREVTAMVWTRRVVNEAQSVELAERMQQCASILPAEVMPALERLAEDERSHVELASAFLELLGSAPPVVAPSLPTVGEVDPNVLLLRCVATGLVVCESVSAARFAAVRHHTDLPIPRACIEYFLRDEIAHAELGFALLPQVLEALSARLDVAALLQEELRATFRHLDLVVGLDAERRGLELSERPQPPMNAGVVEPAIDALAFYECIQRTVVPRLSKLGVDAASTWERRWSSGLEP